MTFKKTEQEIIKAIVKYGGEVKSLAEVINKSQLLESRGIAIIPHSECNWIFLDKNKYEYDAKEPIGYIAELVSLIEYLKVNKYITITPYLGESILVVGRAKSRWYKPGCILVDEEEIIDVDSRINNWYNQRNEQIYWPVECPEKVLALWNTLSYWFTISKELEELVKNDFKSEDQIRFAKQQRLTWISIAVTGVIGLTGLIIAIIGILIR